MKKSTLLFLFLFCGLFAQAQVALDKGTRLHDVGGNLYIPFGSSYFSIGANYKTG
jgi:hypothetical protein